MEKIKCYCGHTTYCDCGPEEPKQETLTYSDALKKEERIFNSTMIFKQETIEEVAEKILANNFDGLKDALQDNDLFFFYKGVIQCYGEAMAKWQQERSYSEEDMKDAYEQGARLALISQSDLALHKGKFPTPDEWFEQFKKEII